MKSELVKKVYDTLKSNIFPSSSILASTRKHSLGIVNINIIVYLHSRNIDAAIPDSQLGPARSQIRIRKMNEKFSVICHILAEKGGDIL